nr:MFS transporter [Nakamurella endophytica]
MAGHAPRHAAHPAPADGDARGSAPAGAHPLAGQPDGTPSTNGTDGTDGTDGTGPSGAGRTGTATVAVTAPAPDAHPGVSAGGGDATADVARGPSDRDLDRADRDSGGPATASGPADRSNGPADRSNGSADRSTNGSADRGTNGSDHDSDDRRRWRALAVCLVGSFMVLLDVSIVNVALRSISQGLGASGEGIQWVLSGYALTFGLLLVPGGRLGDVRGRRALFVGGLIAFTATSALCGAAQNETWLVVARLLQGLAGGLLTPQVSGLIQQLFQGRDRGRAFGMLGAVVGISTALGPLIGGLLIQAFGEAEGWRYVFYVNVPVGLIALPFALKLLPGAPDDSKKRHDYDPVGVVLLGLGVVVLLLPFVQEQQWKGAVKWLLVPLAVALLVGFVLWERRYARRGHEPMVDLHLFRLRSFSFGSSMISSYFAGFTPLFFVLTLLLQAGLGYSALLAGVTSVPFAIGSGIAAPIAGNFIHRFGRPLIAIGLVLVVLGFGGVLLAVHLVPNGHVGWALIAPLLVGGLGSGMVISPNQTVTLSEVPVQQGGTAGGLLQVGQRIGAAIGIAAVGSVFYGQLADSRGDYPSALQGALWISIGFLVLALLVTVADLVVDRRASATAAAGREPAAAAA